MRKMRAMRPFSRPAASQTRTALAGLSESRWQGIVMPGFGAVALYAILTWDGTPAEFIGV